MDNQQLIHQLSQQRPVKVRSPLSATTWSIGFSLFVFYLLSQVYQIRPDLLEKLTQPLYIFNLSLLGVSTLLCAFVSAWIAVPNLRSPLWLRLIAFLPIGLWGLSMIYSVEQAWKHHPALLAIEQMDWVCLQNFMLFLLLPGAFMLFSIRRLAPVSPSWSAGLALLFATSLGNFALMLLEQNHSLYHQTVWHFIPTLLFTTIGLFYGKVLLRW